METMDRTMDKIHSGLVKKFHALCHNLCLNEAERTALLWGYGVDSSVDMDTHDLIDLCAALSRELNKKNGKTADMDRLRKQTMAAIGNYLRATGKESNATIIKGIACRATEHKDFNKIPVERLRNLIALFNNKVKDMERVEKMDLTDVKNNHIIAQA